MTPPPTLELLGFTPALAPEFARLNRAWIIELFALEPEDEAVLDAPEKIVADGGAVRFVRIEGKTIGTGALLNLGDGVGEIAKMAVDPACRGQGLGRILLLDLIGQARALGFRQLKIETSSRLANAIHLYRSVGFVDDPAARSSHGFTRSDVFLLLELVAAS